MKQRCEICGHDNEPGAAACSSCGSLFSDLSETAEGRDRDSRKTRISDPDRLIYTSGDLIDHRYRVVEELGRGGMGIVYRVVDTRLSDEELALKMIHPELVADPEARRRFMDEVTICRRLNHPAIIRVYHFDSDFDSVGKQSYFTMEYLAGQSLAALIAGRKERPLPLFSPAELRLLLLPLLEGLAYAHQFTVHRDIKPDNIFVLGEFPQISVKLLDFGIARTMSASRFTRTSQGLGSTAYVAPEQLDDASRADLRADIYAMGAVLYELLTGIRFVGIPEMPGELIGPGYRPFDDLLRKTLANTPERRLGDCASLQVLLEQTLDQVEAAEQQEDRDEDAATGHTEPQSEPLPEPEPQPAPEPEPQAEPDSSGEEPGASTTSPGNSGEGSEGVSGTTSGTTIRRMLGIGLMLGVLGGGGWFYQQQQEQKAIAAEKIAAEKIEAENRARAEQAALLQKQQEEEQKAKDLAARLKREEEERQRKAAEAEQLRKEQEAAEQARKAAELARKAAEEKRRQEEAAAKAKAEEEKQRRAALAAAEKKKREEEERRRQPAKEIKDPTTQMEFVLIPGGCFMMGDSFGDGYSSEKPVHEVCVDSFYMGKYEVTQGEYIQIMQTNPSSSQKGDRYPVENVSWNATQQFIGKLNGQSKRAYRLPTEAEWEYVAGKGAGTNKARFGNGKDILRAEEANFDASADWKKTYSVVGKYRKSTIEVGSFDPNPYGIYDLAGNVWEWCGDWYGGNYYQRKDTDNPTGPDSGTNRVFRGGSWINSPRNVRAAFRDLRWPEYAFNDLGFRLVLPVQ